MLLCAKTVWLPFSMFCDSIFASASFSPCIIEIFTFTCLRYTSTMLYVCCLYNCMYIDCVDVLFVFSGYAVKIQLCLSSIHNPSTHSSAWLYLCSIHSRIFSYHWNFEIHIYGRSSPRNVACVGFKAIDYCWLHRTNIENTNVGHIHSILWVFFFTFSLFSSTFIVIFYLSISAVVRIVQCVFIFFCAHLSNVLNGNTFGI